VREDALVVAARDLLAQGPTALTGPHADAFVEQVGRQHPAASTYLAATTTAIAHRRLPDVWPEHTAAAVFRNFIWTQFVARLVMAAFPADAALLALSHFDMSELQSALDLSGPAILSCFHYTGHPLAALALAMSPMAPLISTSDIERAGSTERGDHIVYLADRSATIRITRALRAGRSVWALLDVVLPPARVVSTRFLGSGMNVGAGLGTIARLSGRPCMPLFWELDPRGTKLRTGPAVFADERSEDVVAQDFVSIQEAFIARYPAHWLQWYSVLDDSARLRVAVNRGNDELWARLAPALA
jgi:lauroyl/myristoyl acyltransferase